MLISKTKGIKALTIFGTILFGVIPKVVFGDDTTPPELVEFDFTPNTIDTTTGPAVVTFTLRIIDDLSGFQEGQLLVTSPTGGQHRSVFIHGEGELDRTFEVNTEFPLDSETGTWFVTWIYLRDNVYNDRLLYTQDLINLGFPTIIEVTSGQDTTPPELDEFDYDPKSIDTSASSATLTFTLRIIDDLSGFQEGQLLMTSPSGGQHRSVFIHGEGELDRTFEVNTEFPQYSETGTWFVTWIYLRDNVYNDQLFYTQDLINLGFPTTIEVISNPDDTTDPQLAEFDFIPKTVYTSAGPAAVTFTLRIIDDLSGFQEGQLLMTSPSGGQHRSVFIHGEGELDRTFEVNTEFPQYSETGTWFVTWIYLRDNVYNDQLFYTQDLINLGFPTELQVIENQVPTAVAKVGGQLPIAAGDTIQLDGSESSDPDGDALTYSWSFDSRPEGSLAGISDPTAIQTSFLADLVGTYVIRLIVNDGTEDSEPDTVTIAAVSPEDASTETLIDAQLVLGEIPPENLHNENAINPLMNKINAALTIIDEGLYEEALDKLQNDVLQKTDGCATSHEPDNNDWVLTCDNQATFYPLIIRAIELLSRLVE